jgi:hypothetical protein
MFFVALHFRKLKNKKLIIQGFEKAKWLKIGCKCQTREKKGWVSVMATYVLAQLFIMIGFI